MPSADKQFLVRSPESLLLNRRRDNALIVAMNRTTLCFWRGVPLIFLLGNPGLPRPAQAEAQFEGWLNAAPESQGMVSNRLEAFWSELKGRRTTAFLVIRNDAIVFERYAAGFSRTKPHGTASMAKALVGGTSLMLAMSDGRLKPDDLAMHYIPQWATDPLKSKITLRQLATHTSGIEDAEADQAPHEKLTGWKGDFWKHLVSPRDPFTLARDVASMMETPGTNARYSNPGMAMLAYCITVSLRGSTNADLRSLLKHCVMEPLGVPASEWSVGYGTTFVVDGLPLVADWGGGSYSPNAVARVGRLMLRKGDWDGKQLIVPSVVAAATSYAGLPNSSGLGWWVNHRADGTRVWKAVPDDAFAGSGAGHQCLFVVPSLNLILVRNGELLDKATEYHEGLDKYLITPFMGVFAESPSTPPPPSPVIKQIQWASKESIVRQAKGSDNWPMTWGDDDALYTAYGDGNGFEPFVPAKLSLGFAKVLGVPPRFSGVNIRSSTGEQLGDGPRGKKASGILMVDGVLYLWARNAGNAQLAWSADHGAAWTWADWKFTNSFGCPTFLNFGRNYTGARDGFVYVYSPDHDSAYQCSDRMVLARVPKDRIKQRGAFEFFANPDAAGQPRWTRNLMERGGVLIHPGRCYRSSITYDAGLKRYLMATTLPATRSRDGGGRIDTRFSGGLAIYDAPEPWGPWATTFLREQWDVGPGDTASFPTKWMNADGKTLYLVFSSEDSFAVRQATLPLRSDPQAR
jgi:CubicO group peptidase (beta-lactamase class C family)